MNRIRKITLMITGALFMWFVFSDGAMAYWVVITGYAHSEFGSYAGGGNSDDKSVATGELTQMTESWYASTHASGPSGSADTTVNLINTLGHVRGEIVGTAMIDPEDTTGTMTRATGFAQGEWLENFTITSSTLPAGTPVDIYLGLWLSSTIDYDGPVDEATGVRAWVSPHGSLPLVLERNYSPGTVTLSASTVLTGYTVGSVLTVDGAMSVEGYTYASNISGDDNYDFGSVVVQALNSAVFGIEVLTPGAGYTSESGTVYPTTAVPLPGSALLLISGAIGWWVYRKRRRYNS